MIRADAFFLGRGMRKAGQTDCKVLCGPISHPLEGRTAERPHLKPRGWLNICDRGGIVTDKREANLKQECYAGRGSKFLDCMTPFFVWNNGM